ncbi:hypothetical protein EV424DRAFT_1346545 [Suillus variegatus]|nr:hypothetical protein EV424DRAFT_1346545 [Suillus variegatus]
MVLTHPSNAAKRPAQVVLDTKQKWRTSAQIKADNAHIQQANQEKEEKTQKGIERVAAAQEKLSLQQSNASAPKTPCPHPIPYGAKATSASLPSEAGCQAQTSAAVEVDEDNNDIGTMQGKRKCAQKTMHRDAVNAACAVLASQPSNANGKSDAKSSLDLKQAYTGGVMTWAQKVYKINLKKNTHSMKTPKNLVMSQCTSSTAFSQLTRATTAASNATPPPGTPTSLVLGDNFSEGCFPDEEDHPERMAAYALDVIELRSSSLTSPPPPPSQCIFCKAPVKMEHMDSTMDLSKISEDIMFLDYVEDEAKGKGEGEAEGKGDNGGDHFVIEESSNSAQANKRTMMMTNVDIVDNNSNDSAPPTKRVKTEPGQKPGKGITGEVTRAKYKNSDLQLHGIFIPTVAHTTGGDNIDPWLIEDNILIPILEEVWAVIYNEKSLMGHTIVPGSVVYQVTKQHLSEWCDGFSSAAIMMMFTSFIVADPLYDNEDSRADFSDFWLNDNRWLFANVKSDNKKYSAIVVSLHRVSVPSLQSEEQSCQTALALSGVVVKHALHLLSTKQMSFEVKSTIAKGSKKKNPWKGKAPATNGEQWTAVISENKTFSEPLWGYDTSMFLQAINRIPASNMKAIIKQSKMDVEEDIDEEYADIFAFR